MEGEIASNEQKNPKTLELLEPQPQAADAGDSTSEGDQLRRYRSDRAKPAEDGDIDVISALPSTSESEAKIRRKHEKETAAKLLLEKRWKAKGKVQRRSKRRPKAKLESCPDQSSLQPQPNLETEVTRQPSIVETPKPPAPDRRVVIPRRPELTPPKGTWSRLKESIASTITEQFAKLSSRFMLDFPRRPDETPKTAHSSAKTIVAKPKNKVEQKQGHTLKTKTEGNSVAKVSTRDPPKKLAAIMDLRKSRAERGVKSLNMEMGISFVIRKEPVRRKNRKTKVNKTKTASNRHKSAQRSEPKIASAGDRPRGSQPFISGSERQPFPGNHKEPQFPNHFTQFDPRPITSHYLAPLKSQTHEVVRTTKTPSGDARGHDRTSTAARRFDNPENLQYRNYYPATPFTAQFAHLLPTGRF